MILFCRMIAGNYSSFSIGSNLVEKRFVGESLLQFFKFLLNISFSFFSRSKWTSIRSGNIVVDILSIRGNIKLIQIARIVLGFEHSQPSGCSCVEDIQNVCNKVRILFFSFFEGNLAELIPRNIEQLF